MNIEIISRDIIKPSSQNPDRLREIKFSFLDQLAPPLYIPLLLFYAGNVDNYLKRVCLLKKSLADCLANFYPLAGTIRDQSFVDCNDQGIEFLEAQVLNCTLSQVTENPDAKTLNKLLPVIESYDDNNIKRDRVPLLFVQFTVFCSGGIALGLCVSHKIADGNSLSRFVNSWAAIARGSNEYSEIPRFDFSSHFPARDMLSGLSMPDIAAGITKDNIVCKRFVFEKSSIDALREQASSATVECPTRVETLSAFIWKCFIKTTFSKQEKLGVCEALHAVDLRERKVPPLPKESFGNIFSVVTTAPAKVETDMDYRILVSKLRSAIRGANGDYVKKVQNGDWYMKFIKRMAEEISSSGGGVERCNFSSWCKFPFYEVDFGWGKPDWVCSPFSPYKNLVLLMSTKDGDGIEAWVSLLEEDMTLFERDPDLISYITQLRCFISNCGWV